MKNIMMKEMKDFCNGKEIDLLKAFGIRSATAAISSGVFVGATEYLVKKAGSEVSFIKDPKIQLFLAGSSLVAGGLLTYIDVLDEIMHHKDVSAAYDEGYANGLAASSQDEEPDFIVKEDDDD